MKNSVSILNAFRNKYYTDGNNVENGIVANALDDILPEYVKLKKEHTQKEKRGKWEYWQNNDYESGVHGATCTNCDITQSVIFFRRKPTFKFCPHCGAKMDEEETWDNK